MPRIPRRYLRDAANPFEFYYENQFIKRYKFSKDIVRNVILPLVNDALTHENNRGSPVPQILELLLALRYYATAVFQVNFFL